MHKSSSRHERYRHRKYGFLTISRRTTPLAGEWHLRATQTKVEIKTAISVLQINSLFYKNLEILKKIYKIIGNN